MSETNKEKLMKVLGYAEYKKQYPDCPQFVPYGLLDERQAKSNHGQTLDRLNERGGLSPSEMMANIEKREHRMYKNYGFCISSLKHAIKTYHDKSTIPTEVNAVDEGESVNVLAVKHYPYYADPLAGPVAQSIEKNVIINQRKAFVNGYTAAILSEKSKIEAEIEKEIANIKEYKSKALIPSVICEYEYGISLLTRLLNTFKNKQ